MGINSQQADKQVYAISPHLIAKVIIADCNVTGLRSCTWLNNALLTTHQPMWVVVTLNSGDVTGGAFKPKYEDGANMTAAKSLSILGSLAGGRTSVLIPDLVLNPGTGLLQIDITTGSTLPANCTFWFYGLSL